MIREIIQYSVFVVISLAIGIAIGYFVRKSMAEKKLGRAEDVANKLLEEAMQKAEANKKVTIIEAREEVHRLRNEVDKEVRERRMEVQRPKDVSSKRKTVWTKKSATWSSVTNAASRFYQTLKKHKKRQLLFTTNNYVN